MKPNQVLLDSCHIIKTMTDNNFLTTARRVLQSIDAEFIVSRHTIFEIQKKLKQDGYAILKEAEEKLGVKISVHYSTQNEKNWMKRSDVKFLCHKDDRPILAAAKIQNFILLTMDKTLRNISNHFGVKAFHPLNGGFA